MRLVEAERDVADRAPIHLGHGAAGDRDLIAAMVVPPDGVRTGRERGKDRGEQGAPTQAPFQNRGVRPEPIVPVRAGLDLPAAKRLRGMDDQRPDAVPNVQDDMPAGRPLNVSRHHGRLSVLRCVQ